APEPKPTIRYYLVERDVVGEEDYAEELTTQCVGYVLEQLYWPEDEMVSDHTEYHYILAMKSTVPLTQTEIRKRTNGKDLNKTELPSEREELAGFVMFKPYGGKSAMEAVYVIFLEAGQGIGKAMFQHIENVV
ncbi:hypothetical protein HK098_006578, partial [Nowakowskiella sp. JEL0407]